MVASISSQILQIRKENIKQSLSDIGTICHRQDYIATVDGVEYVRPQKPIERTSDIVVRMAVIHLLLKPCHLILHPLLPR